MAATIRQPSPISTVHAGPVSETSHTSAGVALRHFSGPFAATVVTNGVGVGVREGVGVGVGSSEDGTAPGVRSATVISGAGAALHPVSHSTADAAATNNEGVAFTPPR